MHFNAVPTLSRACHMMPAYMVPSLVISIDEWPRTSSGKIDRKRLPTPEAREGYINIVAPRTAQETTVRDVFAAVLGLDADVVSIHASFFDLGGSSLTVVQLVRKLSVALGRGMRAADVMQWPTAAQLAGDHEETLHIDASPLNRPTAALHWLTAPSRTEELTSLLKALVCILSASMTLPDNCGPSGS